MPTAQDDRPYELQDAGVMHHPSSANYGTGSSACQAAPSSKVFVTGATGFIGVALCEDLTKSGRRVLAARRPSSVAGNVEWIDTTEPAHLARALSGCSAVIHLAGVAHRHASAEVHRAATIDAMRSLAKAAQQARVPRFIFISTIKAAAEFTTGRPVNESHETTPDHAYGAAKLTAERIVSETRGVSAVCLRTPLVHGPNVRANFAALLALADSAAPLPLGGFKNARNLIARDSLIAAIDGVLARPDGPSGVFHVADQPALSTSEIVAALREGLGRAAPVDFAPVVPAAVRALGFVWPAIRMLSQSLEVDDSKFRRTYGYGALDSRSAYQALIETARAWKKRR